MLLLLYDNNELYVYNFFANNIYMYISTIFSAITRYALHYKSYYIKVRNIARKVKKIINVKSELFTIMYACIALDIHRLYIYAKVSICFVNFYQEYYIPAFLLVSWKRDTIIKISTFIFALNFSLDNCDASGKFV